MSFGKMNTPVEIMKRVIETDDEGFKNERLKTVASVRAYRAVSYTHLVLLSESCAGMKISLNLIIDLM